MRTHLETYNTHTYTHTVMLKEAQQHSQSNLQLKVRRTTNVHFFVMQLKKKDTTTVCATIYIYTFVLFL